MMELLTLPAGRSLRILRRLQLQCHLWCPRAPPGTMRQILRMQRMRGALGATAGRCMAEVTPRSGRPAVLRRATTGTSTDLLVIQAFRAAKGLSRASSADRRTILET